MTGRHICKGSTLQRLASPVEPGCKGHFIPCQKYPSQSLISPIRHRAHGSRGRYSLFPRSTQTLFLSRNTGLADSSADEVACSYLGTDLFKMSRVGLYFPGRVHLIGLECCNAFQEASMELWPVF